MTKEQLTAVELFAGIGGFRLGLAGANIKTIWANDINELCCKVYESNFHKDSITLGDINEIPISNIPVHDILTAGFPCQPFSPAGKKLGVISCPPNHFRYVRSECNEVERSRSVSDRRSNSLAVRRLLHFVRNHN